MLKLCSLKYQESITLTIGSGLAPVSGHMEKLEMENMETGNWKWKLETENGNWKLEMETGN